MPKLNDNTEVALPLRNMISLIAAASIATWAYFGIVERLNNLETSQTMMKSDLEMNTEFRIKWPRGEMGSLPADSEQFMLIEHLANELEKLTQEIESGQAPFDQQQKLQIDFMLQRIEQLEATHEKIRNDIMDLIHSNSQIRTPSANKDPHAGH
tara:strand:- start:421 stop:882 length:462 start_codon:yes stop_codon:yes gene_type:complete